MIALRLCVLVCCCSAGLWAADAVEAFNRAMSDNDAYEKRDAIQALARSSASDDVVLPLLVSALRDRQGRRWAVPALRQRTGLQPAPSEDANEGYPGYPSADTAAGWQRWLDARRAAQEEAATLQAALTTAQEAEQTAQAAIAAEAPVEGDGAETGEDAEATGAAGEIAEADAADEPAAADPRGQLDRIFFTDGSILRAYVLTKRVDLAGNLTSIRIAHRDGAGEEIIDAERIARIEEDYQ